jgi:anthranilate synthase/aminodeoxychorismate synthase-like glutamine amidotransferase
MKGVPEVILMIDNYDSFTYNLVQYLGELGEELVVVRNDQISIADIEAKSPKMIVLSPGPKTPDDAGICLEIVQKLSGKFPIFGVCLGHQTIAQAFGAKIVQADRLMHGKTSKIIHDEQTIFRGIPSPFTATRYHSLIVAPETLPSDFTVSAKTAEGEIMAIRHQSYPLEGVQFHPESILSEYGKELLVNFLQTYCTKGS